MTTVNRNAVLVGLILFALTAISMAFSTGGGDRELYIILFAEVIAYFVASILSSPRATIAMAVGSALTFTMVRAICYALGWFLAYVFLAVPDSSSVLSAWVTPVPAIFGIVILLLTGPYIIAVIAPDLIGREDADKLLGGTTAAAAPRTQGGVGSPMETSPTGGFIQVFSYEELAGVIKKSQGLEGFVIYSTEGLVVWRDLGMRLDVDALIARVMNHSNSMALLMADSGLNKVRRVMVESKEHFLIVTTLNQNFGIVLLFSSRVTPEDILGRISMLVKSTREFLQWRYPSLPMATGLSRDRIPLESL